MADWTGSPTPKGANEMRRFLLFALASTLAGCATTPPGTSSISTSRPPSVADPGFLEQYAKTRRFSAGRPRSIRLLPDGSAALFLRPPKRSRVQDLYEFDTTTGEERVLLTAEQILKGAEENLTAEELARRERMRQSARGIASYRLSKDGTTILVPLSGRLFVINRSDGQVRELTSENGYPIDPRFSPDHRHVSCVRDSDLYITDVASGDEQRLTVAGGEGITNGLSEFVAQEEMGRFAGYWWSPDSRMIAYQQTDINGLETMHIMDAMYPATPPHTWPYPRPGHANADVRLGILAVTGGDTVWVEWDRELYPYLATVKWKENAPLTILVQNRKQTEERLLSVDPFTGKTTTLLVERDEAWINLAQSMPYWLADGSGFFWLTERNGAWQLEHRDRYGKMITPITTTDFRLNGFVHYDEGERTVYLSGGDDPTQTHIYSVSIDNAPSTPRRLTIPRGNHSMSFSRNSKVYLHKASTADGRSSQTIHRKDGTEIGRLRSVGEDPPFVPNVEYTTVGKEHTFHAALIRPRNFVAGRRYPVIVNVYGGPHGKMVSASPSRYILQQWIADHGFIIVTLDGRGTPARGRDWERTIKNDLIKVPLQDQVDGLQALGRRYAELDLSRVGIYGWSFGGYFSAMAVMQRPDVYHVGVAGAPVCDWADYDTHYTERYMGLPVDNPDGYKAANVLTYCKDLERPLLIIHGTADDNVYFAHSLKMSNALFRAGKDHDFLALSGFTHMVADPEVTTRLYERIVSFFQEHLMGG